METMTTERCLEQIKEAAKKRDEMIDRAREFYRSSVTARLWSSDAST
jgi:vacuolar-type H+-ATPase subunit H